MITNERGKSTSDGNKQATTTAFEWHIHSSFFLSLSECHQNRITWDGTTPCDPVESVGCGKTQHNLEILPFYTWKLQAIFIFSHFLFIFFTFCSSVACVRTAVELVLNGKSICHAEQFNPQWISSTLFSSFIHSVFCVPPTSSFIVHLFFLLWLSILDRLCVNVCNFSVINNSVKQCLLFEMFYTKCEYYAA